MMIDGYQIYFIKLPRHIYGGIRIDEDGFASIYVSAALTWEMQREVIEHELRHLARNDMYSEHTIYRVEREARSDRTPRGPDYNRCLRPKRKKGRQAAQNNIEYI